MLYGDYVIYANNLTGERRQCHKDDLEQILEAEELTRADVSVILESDFNAEELAELLGNELENQNYHSLASVPNAFLKELEAQGFSTEEQFRVLRSFTEVLKAKIL